MGSVEVYSTTAILGLIEDLLANATIDGTGQLVVTRQDGTTSVIGYVRNHGELIGLSDDDHPQYALADGTRGTFATVSQGAKADAARINTATDITINAGDLTDGYLEEITVSDDNSSTTNWINRWVWKFLPYGVGEITRLVTLLNEYGELRGIPAKLTTTWLRMFLKDSPTNPSGTRDPDVPIAQLMDDRTNRNPIWGLYPDGKVRVGVDEIEVQYSIVLGAADPVPANLPANTLIFRTP